MAKKNKAKKSCKSRISDRCLHKVPLTCTEYEGILPVGSAYDEDDCLTGEDIIEDIINILDDHTEQLDFSEFGCCQEYEASDEEKGVQLKDILSAHESMLCDHEERITKLESGTTESNSEGCNDCEEQSSNFIGLVYNTSGVGNVTLNSSYATYSAIQTYNLKYKTKTKGTYKITLDIDFTGNSSPLEKFSVGISVDSQQPATGVFNQDEIKVDGNNKVIQFLMNVDKGANLLPMFKKAPTVNVIIEKVKLIIEKVK